MEQQRVLVPPIAFLGICDRARYDRGNPPALSRIDILGLRNVVLPYIYPFDLSGLYLAFAVYGIQLQTLGPVVLRDRKGNQVFRMEIKTSGTVISNGTPPQTDTKDQGFFVPVQDVPAWSVFLSPMKGVLLTEPQIIDAFLSQGDRDLPLGVLSFGLAQSPPLTPDRVAAIKSDPGALKAARLVLACKYCDSKLKVYTALERSHSAGKDAIWYQDIPDSFDCSCGKTHMSLAILRSNMHALLGETNVTTENLSYSTLYEHRAIDQLSEDLLRLVNRDPGEEEVQQFLSQNSIVFHFLSPCVCSKNLQFCQSFKRTLLFSIREGLCSL